MITDKETAPVEIENKAGYKKTKLGWIPENWDVVLLEEVSRRGSGHTPEKQKQEYYNGGIKWISLADSNKLDQGLIRKTTIEISAKGLQNSSAVLHPKGTVLLSRDAGVGKSAVMAYDMAVSQHFITWECGSKLHNWFLYYYLQKQKPVFERIAVGSTIKTIGLPFFKKYFIPMPPLPEQEKIADILGCWDEAINKQQQLIAAKEGHKKALMQQLLTGKKRLPGFTKDWTEGKIKFIAKEVSQKNKEDSNLTVLSCTKYHGLVPSLEYFGRRVFSENLNTYKIVPENCFAYATNHIEEGSVGYQSQYKEALISPMYTVFRTNETICDNYFFRILKSHIMLHEYQRRMKGSIDRRGGLRWKEFSLISLNLPSLNEQKAINSVFQTADKELSLLQQKLNKFKEQKKALMQMLLNGRVRVDINN